jgi:hypothetical protein
MVKQCRHWPHFHHGGHLPLLLAAPVESFSGRAPSAPVLHRGSCEPGPEAVGPDYLKTVGARSQPYLWRAWARGPVGGTSEWAAGSQDGGGR